MATASAMPGQPRRRLPALLPVVAGVLLAGCGPGGPPADFFVNGEIHESGTSDTFALEDGIAWDMAGHPERYILLTDRKLPALTDDPYAPIDVEVALNWLDAPRVLLTVDAQAELIAYAMWHHGGTRAVCSENPGACSSAVAWPGPDAIAAGYGMRDYLDASLSLPVRHPAARQYIDHSAMYGVYQVEAFSGDGQPASMYGAYERIRAALDGGDPVAFLTAQGIDAASAKALAAMDGMTAAVQRLAATCPAPGTFEEFGEYGTWGGLLVHPGDGEAYTITRFRRRGDGWVLFECGGG